MINKIKVKNFKSIPNLDFELGRFNVIIGENGCGKTNVLEAITFAAAASSNKLDNEFLANRIRVTPPEFMVSAFDEIEIKAEKNIINISVDDNQFTVIRNNNKWETAYGLFNDKFFRMINEIGVEDKTLLNIAVEKAFEVLKNDLSKNSELNNFLIYSPEESKLRNFSDETQILPLGRKGEGLFQYLKQLSQTNEGKVIFNDISEGLSMLDWFDGFKMPSDLLSNEFRLDIGDRYLKDTLHYFDQRSTNEGFLYLLFYLTLFSSKDTPSFFAIDNIESSFNPKLCTKLIKFLVDLANKNDKQVIVTTHNPFVLDGLDLSDDKQRLFVARRNIDGHTKLKRIPYKENNEMKLSEIWMKGFIGGLPDKF